MLALHHPFLAQVASKYVMCSSLHPGVVSDSKYMKLLLHCLLVFSVFPRLLYSYITWLLKRKLNFGGIFKQHGKSARRVCYGVIRILHPEVYLFPLVSQCLSRFSALP